MNDILLYAIAICILVLAGALVLLVRYIDHHTECPHNHRQTEFKGVSVLRDLFSGRMTIEEYRAVADEELYTVVTCIDCGKVWKR